MHLVISPHEIYWICHFWKERRELIISKREPVLVIIFSNTYSIFIFLAMTTFLIKFEVEEYRLSSSIQNLLLAVHNLAYVPFIWITVLIAIGRYWLIYYKISYNVAVINNKWQSVLDPNIGQKNWYLQNIRKWGSFLYLRKWLISYFIFGYLCANIYYILIFLSAIKADSSLGDLIYSVCSGVTIIFCMLIPMIVGVFILCKMPSFKDDIGIRKELKYCLSLMLFSIVSYVGIMTLITYQSTLNMVHDNIIYIEWYLYYLFLRILATLITLNSTKSIIKTFDKVLHGRFSSASISATTLAHKKTYAELDETDQVIISYQNEANDMSEKVLMLRQEMRNAIKTQVLFDAFMDHLFNEYCGECLLSVVEFMQFKNKIMENSSDIQLNDDESIVIKLPEHIVKSKIVYGTNDYKTIAFALYEKYIRVAAEWEININYRDRNLYLELFQVNGTLSNDEEELYILYDICIKQMFGLLLGSFTRFRHSKKYQMINHYSPPPTANSQHNASAAFEISTK